MGRRDTLLSAGSPGIRILGELYISGLIVEQDSIKYKFRFLMPSDVPNFGWVHT